MLSSGYLDPKNALSFKKIFGDEKHKSIIIDFLNAALNLTDDQQITDLEFLNTIQPNDLIKCNEPLIEILVKDKIGEQFIVEMQVIKYGGFEKRVRFYASKTYYINFEKSGKYYDSTRVVFLAIMNFVAFPDKNHYKAKHATLDIDTHQQDLKNTISYIFVELPKFTKTIDQLSTVEDQWYYFFKHATENHKIYEVLCQHPEIKKAYDVLDRYHWTEEEIQYYEALAKYDADYAIGREEGRKIAQLEVAKNMLKENFSLDQISTITGLSIKEVETLRA